MEVVKLKKRDNLYVVPGADSDMCCLSVCSGYLNIWSQTAIAGCLHVMCSKGQCEYMKWMYAGIKSECLQFFKGSKV